MSCVSASRPVLAVSADGNYNARDASDAAVTNQDDIGRACLLTDLVGDDTGCQVRVGAHAALAATLEKSLEQSAAALL